MRLGLRSGVHFLLAAFCAGLWPAGRLAASQETTLRTASGVEIVIAGFLDEPPLRGYAPLRVTLRNLSNRDGEWRFQFSASADYMERRRMESVFELRVEANSLKTVHWNVPVYPVTGGATSRYAQLNVRVTGPGASGNTENLLRGNRSHGGGSDAMMVGMGGKPAQAIKEALRQGLDSHRNPTTLHTLDLDLTPPDAKGLSGLDVIMLDLSEWREASAHRDTLNRWMALGGRLILTGAERDGEERVGLGSLRRMTPDWFSDVESRLMPDLLGSRSKQQRLNHASAYQASNWSLRDAVEDITRPFGLFMVVVIVIAGLLGPVNLWLGFRRRRVMQLIWTTPAISLALSLLVGLGIVVGDGFGGRGHRSLLVMVLPEENLEVKLQEQVSRTGVLLNGRFTLPEDVGMYPVRTESGRPAEGGAMLEWPDGARDGDWFANRRIQGQVLERARSSRARVAWIPGEDGRPPRVVSTLNTTLGTLVLRDREGNHWRADQVTPGRGMDLSAIRPAEAAELLDSWRSREEGPFPIGGAAGRNGWFAAVAASAGTEYLPTLKSIRWEDRPVVYTGPYVERRAP